MSTVMDDRDAFWGVLMRDSRRRRAFLNKTDRRLRNPIFSREQVSGSSFSARTEIDIAVFRVARPVIFQMYWKECFPIL